jgi:hypothetical protein
MFPSFVVNFFRGHRENRRPFEDQFAAKELTSMVLRQNPAIWKTIAATGLVASSRKLFWNLNGERTKRMTAEMKKAASIARSGLCNFNPATTYVPTQLPMQYHRPGEA